eukprot:CAMPEP_0195519602 /NCGR_PEP_ID=MMETSP0794_2-20130614/15125_1 /TAXON_ID=515487 /ORGANISM="Stephanopyxis turris, Strain CCMP 815" /LENGTH=189 /DNA_ID=CAMNT_0040648785 /DNA_START=39 /DNA_END=608 /DNA_ORIENTATION=+
MANSFAITLLAWTLAVVSLSSPSVAFMSGISITRSSVSRVLITLNEGRSDSVKDFMTTPCYSLTPDMALQEAAKFLVEKKVAGAPVVDSDEKVVGVISQFDFLCKEAGGVALELTSPTYTQDVKKIMSNKVKTSMTPKPIVIEEDASMQASALLMMKKRLNRLPVVDREGKLVGLLSSSDVMRHIVGEL